MDGPEEIAFVEARLVPTTEADQMVGQHELPNQGIAARTPAPKVEQQALPIEEPTDDNLRADEPQTEAAADEATVESPLESPRPRMVSPYAEGL
jgi:hypothetical protein